MKRTIQSAVNAFTLKLSWTPELSIALVKSFYSSYTLYQQRTIFFPLTSLHPKAKLQTKLPLWFILMSFCCNLVVLWKIQESTPQKPLIFTQRNPTSPFPCFPAETLLCEPTHPVDFRQPGQLPQACVYCEGWGASFAFFFPFHNHTAIC